MNEGARCRNQSRLIPPAVTRCPRTCSHRTGIASRREHECRRTRRRAGTTGPGALLRGLPVARGRSTFDRAEHCGSRCIRFGFGDAVALKPSLHAARFAGSRFAIPARSFSLCWPQHRRDCRSCRAPPGCPVLAPCLSARFVSGLFVSAPARRAPERATRTPGEGNPCRDPGSPASLQLSWRCASMSPRASRPDESFTGTGRTAGDEAPRINRIAHVAHIAHTPAITIHFSISPILLVEHRATGRIAV